MQKRRELLEQIEKRLPPQNGDDALQRVFRRLDAIEKMIRGRHERKGGCVIGNLSTALCDTHDRFRRRLAQCFDEMAREFQPDLNAAARQCRPGGTVDTLALARYIVAMIEGSIMLKRAQQDQQMIKRHFAFLKEHLRLTLEGSTQRVRPGGARRPSRFSPHHLKATRKEGNP